MKKTKSCPKACAIMADEKVIPCASSVQQFVRRAISNEILTTFDALGSAGPQTKIISLKNKVPYLMAVDTVSAQQQAAKALIVTAAGELSRAQKFIINRALDWAAPENSPELSSDLEKALTLGVAKSLLLVPTEDESRLIFENGVGITLPCLFEGQKALAILRFSIGLDCAELMFAGVINPRVPNRVYVMGGHENCKDRATWGRYALRLEEDKQRLYMASVTPLSELSSDDKTMCLRAMTAIAGYGKYASAISNAQKRVRAAKKTKKDLKNGETNVVDRLVAPSEAPRALILELNLNTSALLRKHKDKPEVVHSKRESRSERKPTSPHLRRAHFRTLPNGETVLIGPVIVNREGAEVIYELTWK